MHNNNWFGSDVITWHIGLWTNKIMSLPGFNSVYSNVVFRILDLIFTILMHIIINVYIHAVVLYQSFNNAERERERERAKLVWI